MKYVSKLEDEGVIVAKGLSALEGCLEIWVK